MSDKKFLIQQLASDAQVSFGINPRYAISMAKRFMDDGHMPMDNPFVAHGNIDSYVMKMLVMYHALNKKQLLKRVKQFAS